MTNVRTLIAAFLFTVTGAASAVQALPPKGQTQPTKGWDSTIILRGAERTAVKSMPIEQRPNRPLHIYGNTIRRMEFRGRR